MYLLISTSTINIIHQSPYTFKLEITDDSTHFLHYLVCLPRNKLISRPFHTQNKEFSGNIHTLSCVFSSRKKIIKLNLHFLYRRQIITIPFQFYNLFTNYYNLFTNIERLTLAYLLQAKVRKQGSRRSYSCSRFPVFLKIFILKYDIIYLQSGAGNSFSG